MDWKVENEMLVKEFEFENFVKAIDFVNRILPIAEEANHHPDVLIHSYKKVKVSLYTHSENKITGKHHARFVFRCFVTVARRNARAALP